MLAQMFEWFTDRAQHVVVLALDAALEFKHEAIGTEHLLLGLLQEREGVGARVLEGRAIDVARVREDVLRAAQSGQPAAGHVRFTPRAMLALQRARSDPLSLGHRYVASEHILLGLVDDAQAGASEILLRLGANLEALRDDTIRMIFGPGEPRTAAGEGTAQRGENHPSRATRDDEVPEIAEMSDAELDWELWSLRARWIARSAVFTNRP